MEDILSKIFKVNKDSIYWYSLYLRYKSRDVYNKKIGDYIYIYLSINYIMNILLGRLKSFLRTS